MNFMNTDPLALDNIRRTLVRLEDTIIFSLIERAQFARNQRMYEPAGFAQVLHNKHFTGSWLEWLLKETESSHSKIRRYDSPDEHPFTPRHLLPDPILPPLDYPLLLHPNIINVNPQISKFYIEIVVPAITRTATLSVAQAEGGGKEGGGGGRVGDDGNYGSAGTRDIECLQAISRRIHCGMFVSESKFRDSPRSFIPFIQTPNPQVLESLITKPAVEAALLIRLAKKANWYGQELGPDGEVVGAGEGKIDVAEVVRLYRDYIIPLTKDVEVEYLLRRLDGLTAVQIQALFDSTSD